MIATMDAGFIFAIVPSLEMNPAIIPFFTELDNWSK
jgi:hypothetical protein